MTSRPCSVTVPETVERARGLRARTLDPCPCAIEFGRAARALFDAEVLMPKKYRDVREALIAAGWRPVRQRGSHEVWAHPDRTERIVVAGKPSDTVPVGTLASIRKASGLDQLR